MLGSHSFLRLREKNWIENREENLDREQRKTFGCPFNQLANEINESDLTLKEQLKQGSRTSEVNPYNKFGPNLMIPVPDPYVNSKS